MISRLQAIITANWNASTPSSGRCQTTNDFECNVPPSNTHFTSRRTHFPAAQSTTRLSSQASFSLSSTTGRSTLTSSSVLPFSLLSGTTVAVFSAVVRHPSSTLTPLSCIYLLLLAIQYAIQPRLSRRYLTTRSNKQTVALVEEVAKGSMAAILWRMQDDATRLDSWKSWSFRSSLWMAAVPASLYAVQGVLQYTSQMHLNALTFNGLSQTKTLFAALACFLVLGQAQSPWQLVGLTGLFVASGLMVMSEFGGSIVPTTKSPSDSNSNSKENSDASVRYKWWSKGVALCLSSAALSGLAGALSQKGLQIAGGGGRNAFLYTMEISIFSGASLLINLLLSATENGRNETNTRHTKRAWFAGWNPYTLIPIMCKAWTGVLTALVHKHAGTVAKGFALMLGLVLAAVLQSLFPTNQPKDGYSGDRQVQKNKLSFHQLVATLIVLLSGWLHFTHPPRK